MSRKPRGLRTDGGLTPMQRAVAKSYLDSGGTKSATQCAREAGYSEQYAHSKGATIVRHALKHSEFTDTLDRICGGRTLELAMRRYIRGLQATLIERDTVSGRLRQTEIPDLKLQMEAADRIVKIHGGIPEVAEPEAATRGLNVVVRVGEQAPTPKILNPEAPVPADTSDRALNVRINVGNGSNGHGANGHT